MGAVAGAMRRSILRAAGAKVPAASDEKVPAANDEEDFNRSALMGYLAAVHHGVGSRSCFTRHTTHKQTQHRRADRALDGAGFDLRLVDRSNQVRSRERCQPSSEGGDEMVRAYDQGSSLPFRPQGGSGGVVCAWN
jgi:hypothetical protein